MLSNNIAYSLLSQQYKSLYAQIELLDWNEEVVEEIQGLISNGSLNLQGDSSIRRTCSFSMTLLEGMEKISSTSNLISINKKIRLKIGVSNELNEHKDLGEIVWFPLGIFVLTSANISRGVENTTLNISAQDKMALLTGSISGTLDSVFQAKIEGLDGQLEKLTIEEIIFYVVSTLGQENRAKIIINDVPKKIKVPILYDGSIDIYFNSAGTQIPSSEGAVLTVKPGEYIGYIMEDFYYPGDLIKQPGDSITSILDDIKNVLGNFEYFYDVDGNFVFQEVKNYINTSFTPIEKLNTGDYISNFEKAPYVFSFKEKDIVNSFSNSPNWANIKNDFIVWGTADEEKGPVFYHLVVDEKPATSGEIPWQQELINYGKANPLDPGKYYGELVSKFTEIYEYDEETKKGEWKTDPNNFHYYFDMIDTNSAYGEYSVSSIGKRSKVINDDKVGRLYPPFIPDFVILPESMYPSEEELLEMMNYLISIGQKFFVPKKDTWASCKEFPYAKDAFSVVRELLYQHTTVNNSITLGTLPLYFLDVNQRIEVYDELSDIKGDYIIKGLSIPLSHEGLMSINAIKALERI